MKEKWKDIKGFENYQISNLGNVKTKERYYINNLGYKVHIKEKLMKFSERSGYYVVNLRKNGIRYSKQVHRLVAENFLPSIENKKIVNHKDFNKKNNCVDNLEWCTQQENVSWSKCNMKKIHIKNKDTYGITYRNRGSGYYEIQIKKKFVGKAAKFEDAIKIRNDELKRIGLYNEIYN